MGRFRLHPLTFLLNLQMALGIFRKVDLEILNTMMDLSNQGMN